MSKPSALPEWNSGGANNLDPGSTKRGLGWVVNEDPASSSFNWWQKLVYVWILWINTVIDDADGTFMRLPGTLTVTGLITANGSPVSLVGNVIAADFGSFGTTLTAGDFQANTAEISGLSQLATAQMTTDLAAPGHANEMSKRTVHRAHAVIALNNSTAPTLATGDKFNVGTVVAAGAGGSDVITIPYTVAFSAGVPCVTATLSDQGGSVAYVVAVSTSGVSACGLTIRNAATGAAVDPTGSALNGYKIYLNVNGATA